MTGSLPGGPSVSPFTLVSWQWQVFFAAFSIALRPCNPPALVFNSATVVQRWR
jgi:hypothetical protein